MAAAGATDLSRMSKRWTVTVWEDLAGAGWEPNLQLWTSVAYGVWGKDKCPKTGRVHWHVYVRFTVTKRGSTVARLFPDGSFVKTKSDTEADARDYCWKEGKFQHKHACLLETGPEVGTFEPTIGKQGKRTDLENISDDISGGTTLESVAEKYPGDYIRYHSGINALYTLRSPLPALERQVDVIVLWGVTGTGKTHRVMYEYPSIYSVRPGRDPWGRYRNESQVLFDEFAEESWPVTDMNRYLDKWRCPLDRRYNDLYGVWTLVVICANSNPASWYMAVAPYLQEAFRRRIRGRTFFVDSKEPTLEEILGQPPTPL